MESVADLADGNKDEQAPAPALPIYKQGAEAVGFAYPPLCPSDIQ